MGLGFGSILIKSIGGFEVRGGCASIHSRASEIALRTVSLGEKLLFSKTSWFLEHQIAQTIQADRIPAHVPVGGSEGIFLTRSHPSCTELKFWVFIETASGAISHTFFANGHLNNRCSTDSSSLHRAQRGDTGIFLIANCSPTGRALCRDFHKKSFIFQRF